MTKDKDGNPMVINMTDRGHGLSPLQAPNQPAWQRKLLSDDTWRDYFQAIGRRVK